LLRTVSISTRPSSRILSGAASSFSAGTSLLRVDVLVPEPSWHSAWPRICPPTDRTIEPMESTAASTAWTLIRAVAIRTTFGSSMAVGEAPAEAASIMRGALSTAGSAMMRSRLHPDATSVTTKSPFTTVRDMAAPPLATPGDRPAVASV
jgi:hypothetical protein